ncbi:MAG: glycosyltransferase family A protein [Bacteroidota bacterium]
MNSTTTPLVSVLMTAYNREKYIAEAIESVLASSYTNFELIITDDGSGDNTVAIAKKYEAADTRVKLYINETNLGDYPNRNKAASYAKGKYLKYVDADDMLYDYGLAVMVSFTERFPEAGFGLGAYPDDDRPFPVLISPKEIYLESFGKINHFDRAPGSGLIKREAFNAVGGFSGKRMIGDYEFWFKIARTYSMVKLPLDLYWNRIHEGQESQTEYARKNYATLRRAVLLEALQNPACPLNEIEIREVLNKARQTSRRDRQLATLSKIKKLMSGRLG